MTDSVNTKYYIVADGKNISHSLITLKGMI